MYPVLKHNCSQPIFRCLRQQRMQRKRGQNDDSVSCLVSAIRLPPPMTAERSSHRAKLGDKTGLTTKTSLLVLVRKLEQPQVTMQLELKGVWLCVLGTAVAWPGVQHCNDTPILPVPNTREE